MDQVPVEHGLDRINQKTGCLIARQRCRRGLAMSCRIDCESDDLGDLMALFVGRHNLPERNRAGFAVA